MKKWNIDLISNDVLLDSSILSFNQTLKLYIMIKKYTLSRHIMVIFILLLYNILYYLYEMMM